MSDLSPRLLLLQLCEEHLLTERGSAQQLERMQAERLALLIGHHAKHTPSFAARLTRARLKVTDIHTPQGLARLPPLSRRDIQNLGASFFCKRVPSAHEPVGTTTTSGSTGEPVTVRKSGLCRLHWGANTARDHRWNRRDVGGRLLSIRPTIDKRTAAADWGFPMAALGRTGPALGLPVGMDIGEHAQHIDEFQPNVLLVFPNILAGLIAAWAKRGAAPQSIRHIKTIGESVSDGLRTQVREVCGTAVEDSYTSQECGVMAIQCQEGGQYHVMTESVCVEVVDSSGAPCTPGQTGRLVVTDLTNFASPVIRYDIGDLAVAGETCRCGLPHPTLQRIVGRDRNLLVLPDGSRRYALAGFHDFHKVAPILQFRLIQHSLQAVELVVHTVQDLDADQKLALAAIVTTALGHPFSVQITRSPDPLKRSPSGKFEDFVSLVPGAGKAAST